MDKMQYNKPGRGYLIVRDEVHTHSAYNVTLTFNPAVLQEN